MRRRHIYLGIFFWSLFVYGALYLYRYVPPEMRAKFERESQRVLTYLERDFVPIEVTFPRRLCFVLVPSAKYALESASVSEELRYQFQREGLYLSPRAKLQTVTPKKCWAIFDGDGGGFYVLRLEGNMLYIYEDVFLLPDDPVNLWNGENFIVVGRIRGREVTYEATKILVDLFPDRIDLLTDKAEFFYSRDGGTFQEVVEQLFSGETGEKLRHELEQIFFQKKEEIFDILSPTLQAMVAEALPHLKKGLMEATARRQQELLGLVQREILEKRLVPALEREIWPVVQKKAPPVLKPIARELWDAFPLMGIVGRELLYRVYLSKKSGEERWREYVQNKAVPILEKHKPTLVNLAQEIATEVASKPSVQAALAEGTEAALAHETFRRALEAIFMEGIVRNVELRKALLEQWDRWEESLSRIVALLEPSIRRATDYLLCKDGDYQKGINPRLARVLRQQILWKDTQWIQVEPGKGEGPLREGQSFVGARLRQ